MEYDEGGQTFTIPKDGPLPRAAPDHDSHDDDRNHHTAEASAAHPVRKNGTPDAPGRPRPRLWRRIAIAAGFAALAALATLLVSRTVSPTYQSSALLRIVVDERTGLSQDSVLASNDLTAQLVQLLPTDAVLVAPAHTLGMSVSALRGSLSVGSVAQENLLQISADAPSAADAQRRTATVAQDFMSYIAGGKLVGYVQALSNAVQRTNRTVAFLSRAHGGLDPAARSKLDAVIGQELSVLNQLRALEASDIPVIQQVQAAGRGSEVSPKPALYALVALLIAGFVAGQVLVLTERHRNGPI